MAEIENQLLPQRLKAARLKQSLSEKQVAQRSGLTAPHYYDLESHYRDLSMTISLQQLRSLCDILQIPIAHLFSDSASDDGPPQDFDFTSLTSALPKFLHDNKMSLAQFEEQSGWDLQKFLTDPHSALNWNLDCLNDVCSAIGVDWIKACLRNLPT